MERMQAIYTADLIEQFLRAEPQTPFGNARDEFLLTHGTFGLRQLFEAEKALRAQWQIPDSKGNVVLEE